MAFTPDVWSQLKNLTADQLLAALGRDGWRPDGSRGAIHAFIKQESPSRRVTIHYHPQKTYGPKLLKSILEAAGWSVDDLSRLGLIKRRGKG